MDVARDVAERQSGLPERLAASSQLFAPVTLLAPSVELLHARLCGDLVPAGVAEILDLARRVSRQPEPTRVASRLLDASVRVTLPSSAAHTPMAGAIGPLRL